MKKFILILVALAVVLYISNPTEADFDNYVEENYQTITRKRIDNDNVATDEVLIEGINQVLRTLERGALAKTTHENFYLFSLTTVTVPGIDEYKTLKYIGVFKLFIRTN